MHSELRASSYKIAIAANIRSAHGVRRRLSCPTREQLGSFLLGTLDSDWRTYIDFHLHTVGCSFCLANLADLQALQKEPAAKTRARRSAFFD